jgi:hypothetical protein
MVQTIIRGEICEQIKSLFTKEWLAEDMIEKEYEDVKVYFQLVTGFTKKQHIMVIKRGVLSDIFEIYIGRLIEYLGKFRKELGFGFENKYTQIYALKKENEEEKKDKKKDNLFESDNV